MFIIRTDGDTGKPQVLHLMDRDTQQMVEAEVVRLLGEYGLHVDDGGKAELRADFHFLRRARRWMEKLAGLAVTGLWVAIVMGIAAAAWEGILENIIRKGK